MRVLVVTTTACLALLPVTAQGVVPGARSDDPVVRPAPAPREPAPPTPAPDSPNPAWGIPRLVPAGPPPVPMPRVRPEGPPPAPMPRLGPEPDLLVVPLQPKPSAAPGRR